MMKVITSGVIRGGMIRVQYQKFITMETATKTFCFQVSTQCPQPTTSAQPQEQPSSHYNFSQLIQEALQEQADRYDRTIDQLNSELFGLRQKVTRLELRNQKDQAAEKALRIEHNLLVNRLNQKQKELAPQQEVKLVETVKEVPVEVDNPVLVAEIRVLKDKIKELLGELELEKTVRKELTGDKIALQAQIELLKKGQSLEKDKWSKLVRQSEDKDRTIEKLSQLNAFLKNNKQVITETKHVFPDWHQPRSVETELKVETVYVDRPVQKAVFVEVPKVVRHFVQPQKAVVNRVISCAPASTASDELERVVPLYEEEMAKMDREISDLHHNIKLHKEERQKLVGVIGERDSQLNILETKMRLMHTEPPRRPQGQPQIHVEVRRAKGGSQIQENGTTVTRVRS